MSTFLNASPIFGPVRSRRLGLSLGVNMMPASGKICTFDCIYCENGLNAERPCHEPYNTAAVVLDALEAKLHEMAAEGELPDVITFAGNGEPTAAPEFPQAIAGAVALRDQLAPSTKIAVLSNGTRADRPFAHLCLPADALSARIRLRTNALDRFPRRAACGSPRPRVSGCSGGGPGPPRSSCGAFP